MAAKRVTVVSTNGLVQHLSNGATINWAQIVPGSPIEQSLINQGFSRPAGAAPAGSAVAAAKNPPAAPFLTGEQIIGQGQAQQSHDQGYQDIADQLAQLALNNQYQKQAIEHGRVSGVAGAQDNAAARGVFNSSIKDGQVYDIDAQAATAQQHLIDNMAAAETAAKARRAILDQALAASQTGYNQAAVENASQIDTGYQQPAAPAAAAPKPAAPKPAPTQTPTATGGHVQGTTPGFHPGHSAGHEFYLPGVGWVSQARYQAGH